MPKCPYCQGELKLNLEINPTPINEKFKDDLIKAYESFIEIQAEVVPFGGKMMKSMAKYSLKFVDRYLDHIGAIPLVMHSCSNCNAVITTESLFDLVGSRSSSSS
ncbi:MAG: hypothetical protein ACFE9R_18835 [Candidatus Hermodarchaeota archaeon]